jgi:hypothetical protein
MDKGIQEYEKDNDFRENKLLLEVESDNNNETYI